MYIYMYVYVYVYIYIHIHTYIYIYIYIYKYVYIYVYIYTYGSVGKGSVTTHSPAKKKYNLEQIDAELKIIANKRLELAKKLNVKIPKLFSKNEKAKKENLEKNDSKVLKNEIDSNSKAVQKPKAKKGLFHSDLEYVVEKMIHSPYLTKPSGRYPESTFTVPEVHYIYTYICVCIYIHIYIYICIYVYIYK
jgi:hypothetical protein